MLFPNHPSLQRLIEDREKAKKLWKAPTASPIEEVEVSKSTKPPKEAFKSLEERMLRALLTHGSLRLRIAFSLLEPSRSSKDMRHYHWMEIPGKISVNLENQGRFLKLIEEIKKLAVDFVAKK